MLINAGTKDQLEIVGYKEDRKRKIATVILCFLTAGLLLLLLSWKPSVRRRFISIVCTPGEADVLIVTDIYGEIYEEKIEDRIVCFKEKKLKQKYFYNKKIKYIWDEEIATFSRISYPPAGTRLSELASERTGLSNSEVEDRKEIYGENATKIEMQTIWHLFISQAFNPFYIFQIYTVVLWCLQEYYLYSGCIFFLSVISLTLNIYETRKQTKVLREKMITESTIKVIRNQVVHVVDSKSLVPGDVVLIEVGEEQLEADVLLLEGSTIMNEAILTGESLPITKVQLPPNEDSLFSAETHKKHILYSGTKVLQVRGKKMLKAVVIQTGYDTVRGEMIRSILFPKPIDFHIYADFLYLFSIFVLIGIAAMIWSMINWSSKAEIGTMFVIISSFDLLTFVVPPILPATITAINLWSQKRLQRNKIFCLSSNYISLAGTIDIVCFDKTGTLTEDDFSVEGIVPCENSEFLPPLKDLKLSGASKFGHTIATCHSVARKTDGTFIGHPLDIKLFTALGWSMTDSEPVSNLDEINEMNSLYKVSNGNPSSPCCYEVLKTYPFVSGEQRMTVIAKETSKPYFEAFIKGAPEKIHSLCSKESVPENFSQVLEWYTKQGLRIIAAASKPLPQALSWKEINKTERESIEENAVFLGLIILQNRLKAETIPALQIIHEALIATVMVTGDNLLTAVNIARQCGLVKSNQQVIIVKANYVPTSNKAAQHLQLIFEDSEQSSEFQTGIKTFKNLKSVVNPNYVFGIDGESFKLVSQYDKETFTKIVHRGKIFARMKPDQKTEVVEALQQLGHFVAMCGDGCNDCGALKVAHSGISLSSTEASVAAPFTSLQKDIGCVATLLREGAATLVSTYISFKYNISCCFLALVSVVFSFSIFTHPSNMQYLIMDLVLITIPSLFIGNTQAASELSQQKPTKRFVHPLHIFSIISFLGFQSLYFWVSWQYLKSQSWYDPFILESVKTQPPPGYELTVTITQVFFAFIVGAVVFSHDYPFRKHFFTNKILTIYLILSTILCITISFCQMDWLYSILDFRPYPYSGFAWTMFLSLSITSFVCYSWERWFLYGFIEIYFIPWINKFRGPSLPFQKLEVSLRSDAKWPKLNNFEDDDESIKNKSSILELEDDHEETNHKPHGFFRKLTKKYRFEADVKYESELKPLSQNLNENGSSAFPSKITTTEDENEVFEQIKTHSTDLAKEKFKSFGNNNKMTKQKNSNPETLLDDSVTLSLNTPTANSAPRETENFVNSAEEQNDENNVILRNKTNGLDGNEPQSSDSAQENEDGLNLIKEMNEKWAMIRSSLHESLKDYS